MLMTDWSNMQSGHKKLHEKCQGLYKGDYKQFHLSLLCFRLVVGIHTAVKKTIRKDFMGLENWENLLYN